MVFDAPATARARRRRRARRHRPAADLDFTGYVFDRVKLHECDYNWKTFIEVYLEDYHVAPFHPGLGQFVTCEDLRWEFGPHHSVQTVGAKNELAKPGSPAYRKWHDAVLAYRDGRSRPGAAPRRDLADLLPDDHGRVVPARAGRLDAVPEGAAEDAQRRRVLLPRGDRTPSSASSSRPSRPRTGRPAPRTTRSRCAWTPAGAR